MNDVNLTNVEGRPIGLARLTNVVLIKLFSFIEGLPKVRISEDLDLDMLKLVSLDSSNIIANLRAFVNPPIAMSYELLQNSVLL
jgi:hypothetical protein